MTDLPEILELEAQTKTLPKCQKTRSWHSSTNPRNKISNQQHLFLSINNSYLVSWQRWTKIFLLHLAVSYYFYLFKRHFLNILASFVIIDVSQKNKSLSIPAYSSSNLLKSLYLFHRLKTNYFFLDFGLPHSGHAVPTSMNYSALNNPFMTLSSVLATNTASNATPKIDQSRVIISSSVIIFLNKLSLKFHWIGYSQVKWQYLKTEKYSWLNVESL